MGDLLTGNKIIRHSNAVAVGTSTVTPSAGIDTAGYDSCTFLALLGAITDGTPSIKVQQSDDDGVADTYDDLLGTSVPVGAVTDDNKMLAVEIVEPKKRYLKCLLVRGGATGTVVDGIVAILGRPHAEPTALDTTLFAREVHVSPAEGTA